MEKLSILAKALLILKTKQNKKTNYYFWEMRARQRNETESLSIVVGRRGRADPDSWVMNRAYRCEAPPRGHTHIHTQDNPFYNQ